MILRRLSTNSMILLFSNVGTALLSFALTLIIARGLGKEALGQFAAVMAWVLPLTMVVDWGMSSLITRDVAKNPNLAQAYLEKGYRLRLAIGGIIIVLVWLLAPWMSKDSTVVAGLQISIPLVLIDTLFGNFTAIFRAWDKMWPILPLNLLLLGLQVIGGLVIIWQEFSVMALFAVIVGADSIQLILTWRVWRYLESQQMKSADTTGNLTSSAYQLAKQAMPFMVAGILATLQSRGIIILLENLENTGQVGQFAAANRLMEAIRLLPYAMFGALFPALSALVENPPELRRVFRFAMGLSIIYASFVILGAFLFGSWFILFIFGEAFRPASEILTILASALFFSLGRSVLTLWFYAHNRENIVNKLTLVAIISQFLTGWWFISVQGLVGAAYAMLIGEAILFILLIGVGRRGLTTAS